MTTHGTRTELVVLIPGPARDALRNSFTPSHWRVVELDREEPAVALELCHARPYLWLHPWTRLSAALVEEIEAWAGGPSRGTPGVACASMEAAFGEVTIQLGRRVVLASPGAALLSSEGPRAHRAARVTRLATTWQLIGPTSVGDHLRAVNAETSCRARLARTLAERPKWSGVALGPLWRTCRAWLGASGPRRQALSHAVLEGYRQAAATAKLWELANRLGDPGE